MTDSTKSRYEINNLPISEETRKGLTQENINYIGAVGRMLSLQDDFIETTLAEQNKAMFTAVTKQTKIIQSIQKLLADIQNELKDHETRISKLEGKMAKLLLEHDHNHSI